MTHLTDNDLNGYIHHTLTDVQRETMDQHLDGCGTCRARLDAARQLQRHIANDIGAALRDAKPPESLSFAAVKPQLKQPRRSFWPSSPTLTAVSTAAVLLLLVTLAYAVMQQRQAQPFGSSPIGQLPAPTLFDVAWTDPAPYRGGLIPAEQAALQLLTTAPTYHLDVTIGDNLRQLNGRQELHFTNRTGDRLDALLFHLLPNATPHRLAVQRATVNDLAVTPTVTANGRLLRIPLPYPLAPGEDLVVSMHFTLQLSGTSRGFNGTLGVSDGTLSLAHFYPVLAAYRDGSWNTTAPIHDLAPVAPTGFFLARVTAPDALTVLGNGREIRRAVMQQDGVQKQVITVAAGPVSRLYLAVGDRFTTMLGDRVGATAVAAYSPAYLQAGARHALQTAVTALHAYNDAFGPYPYTELTLIGVPTLPYDRATTAVPGAILLNLSHYQLEQAAMTLDVSQRVAQQWFGPATGPNYLQAPWLVDGLSAYAVRYADADADPAALTETLARIWRNRDANEMALPIGLPAARYTPYHFRQTMNGRAPLVLAELGQQIGEERLTAVLRQYAQTYRWQAGSTADFRQMTEATCGCNLTEFFTSHVAPQR